MNTASLPYIIGALRRIDEETRHRMQLHKLADYVKQQDNCDCQVYLDRLDVRVPVEGGFKFQSVRSLAELKALLGY